VRPRRRVLALCLLVALAGASVAAQRGGFGRNRRPSLDVQIEGNTPYDGRFVFVRVKYGTGNFGGRQGPPWSHDYPDGEVHFSKILEELTFLNVRTNGSNVLSLDDPELFNYPIAYMAEPGFWEATDTQAANFRAYLLKGGFAIFDDFDGTAQWANFEAQMRRVLPDGRFVRLDRSHRIFGSFFEIKDIDAIVHPMSRIAPSYYGIFEANDPTRRLMVIANFDNDVPEYWEWSGEGLFPFDASNEAYKLGVNYLVYGMTH